MDSNTTDNYKSLRSRSKQSNDEKSLVFEKNDVPRKHDYKTKCVSNNCSENSDGSRLAKIINRKRKSTRTEKEHTYNTSPIPKKKKKYSDEIYSNDHTNTSKTTIKNCKRKSQRIVSKSDIMTKTYVVQEKKKGKNVILCDVCFVAFTSSRNRNLHRQYFMGNGDFKCRRCNEHYSSQAILSSHFTECHKDKVKSKSHLHCNYCTRNFKKKRALQSHLFHLHSEYIYPHNITKIKRFQLISKSTSCKSDTSKNVSHERSLLSSNPDKSKELCTTLINKDCKQAREDDTTNIDKSFEKPSNEEISSGKKLRQPTLNEYLELCKRKHNIKNNLKQLDTMKDDFSTKVLSHDEQIGKSLKSKLLEEIKYNRQFSTLTGKSSNDPEQVAHASTSKQSQKYEECPTKEPFVKLHADVETMKYFLESLPDANVKDEVAEDQCNYDIPYRLRPTRAIRFLGHLSRKLVKKSQLITENSETEQDVPDINKVELDPAKTVFIRPKCKDCTITLKRCDGKIRNRHPASTIQTSFKQELVSTITEPNSTQSPKSDTGNNVVLKELEISLERLEQTEDNVEPETDPAIQDNVCFTCGVCKKNFPTKSDKRMHIKFSHVAYMSSICNARYTVKHKLLQHYLHEHTFKSNECCVCNELLLDSTELKQHLNYHCLKYLQSEDDQYLVDIDIQCSIMGNFTCFKCDKVFSSHLLWSIHDRYCPIHEEAAQVQKDSTKETDMSLEAILQTNHNHNSHESTVILDEKNGLSRELRDNKLVEESNRIQATLVNEEPRSNEEEADIIEDSNIVEEDLEIDKNGPNRFGRKAIFIVEDMIEDIIAVNESQDPMKLPETDNSTINNQDTTTSVQSSAAESNGKTYPCDICGKRFQNQKNLEQHTRSFSRVTALCPLCGTGFGSKRFLQTHIAAAHVPQLSKNYDYHCVFCNQGFVKKYDLRQHVLHLHGRQMLETMMPNFRGDQRKDDESPNANATCSICNLAFETLDRYVEHKMYYYKDHKFRCSTCSENFQGMYMYHHHNKLTHYPEDKLKSYIYNCNICNEGFNHELHFYSHNMHVHSNEESSTEIAKQLTGNSQPVINVEDNGEVIDLLMNPQKKVQLSSTDYICQVCQFKCTDASDLKNHELFYTNDGDFKCDLCKRQCKTLDLLEQHKSLSHICRDIYNEHVCRNCGEILTSITSLNCHKKHFHADLVSRDNANNCKDCGQTFSSSAKCKEHQCTSKSTDKYIYRCFYCDTKFTSLDLIQSHIIHVHFSKLLAKHAALKTELLTVSGDKSQKKSIPQLVDQILVSRRNLAQSFQQSANSPNSILAMQETQDKVAVEPTSDQLKALFLTDNEPRRNIPVPVITANRSEANTFATMEKEQSNQSKADTPIPTYTESANEPEKHHGDPLSDPLNISLEQMLDGHTIFSSTGSANKSKVTFTSVPSKPVNGSNFPIAVTPILANEEVTSQQYLSVNNSTDYPCPLCPLQYPSLMYFHAHLRYAHSDLIRTDLIYPQLDQLTEKISAIECLLCPHISTDEKRYKRHLRHSHMYSTNLKERHQREFSSTFSTALTNSTTRSKSPEVITVEDDSDNDKNFSIEPVAGKTTVKETTCSSSAGNENIGKLKVKSFARIMENLAIDRAIELQNKNN